MRNLAGKVAVVTGAAQGIGRAFAQACSEAGMKVVLADIDSGKLDKAAAALAATSAEGMAMTCDVASAEEMEELANVAFGTYGAVHLLCLNAGVAGTAGPCWEIRGEDWRRDLGVNLWGVIHGIRSFVPRMIQQGGEGHIVATASIMGLLPTAMAASYGVSKAAVISLCEALAIELRESGCRIGVSVVCPAAVATAIAASLRPEGEQGESLRESVHDSLQQGLSAELVAARMLDAVREERFAVFPHEDTLPLVRKRIDTLLSGTPPLRQDL